MAGQKSHRHAVNSQECDGRPNRSDICNQSRSEGIGRDMAKWLISTIVSGESGEIRAIH